MFLLALRQLLSRRAGTLLAGAGLLTASLGFIVLTSTARTTEAVLSGDIGRAWSTPYDLLVRPPSSVTPPESGNGLVRPNFVSGINGGITRSQLEAIRAIPGVQVAAPVAAVGFVDWRVGSLTLNTADLQPTGALTVFRVSVNEAAQAGMSQYPVEKRYLAVATEGNLELSRSGQELHVQGRTVDCTYPVSCYAPSTCSLGRCGPTPFPAYELPISQPIVIAGIDPKAEAALARLDTCVVSGRYLSGDDRIAISPATPTAPALPSIPVLASARSFVDETFAVDVARAADATPVLAGTSPQQLTGWRQEASRSTAVDSLYRSYLPSVDGSMDTWPIWTVGDVSYQPVGQGHLAAATTAPSLDIFKRNVIVNGPITEEQLIPPEVRDTAFRSVREHAILTGPGGFDPGTRRWRLVGTYDPGCLPGFDPLAGGRLETYAPPTVKLADGRLLGPTRSMADYVNSPPLLLTTLEGASWFSDRQRFPGQPGNAFISVIRVKARGVDTPGPVAEARLSRIAGDIHDATGLQVDIVKGSSLQTVEVDLPAGTFGRPGLTVREGWSVKGVAYRFSRAVSTQNVALFALVLVSAMVLAGQTAYAAVRRRRAEFGTMRALGWPRWKIAWLVELETLLLGVGVGIAASLAGLAAFAAFKLEASPILLVLPIVLAPTVAGLAGIVPALAAGRGATVRLMARGGNPRRSRPPTISALALRELGGAWRAEALLGALAIALGSALLDTTLLVAQAFRGQLDETILGVYLAARVQPFHLALALLTLAIGALAAGQIITLSYIERQPQMAVLRAIGWPRSRILQLLGTQAIALGVVGGIGGGLIVALAGWLLRAPTVTTAPIVATGCIVAAIAAAAAAAGPLVLAYRLAAADALRGE